MKGSSSSGVVAALLFALGCFPDPPRRVDETAPQDGEGIVEDVVDASQGGELETVEDSTPAGDEASLDEETRTDEVEITHDVEVDSLPDAEVADVDDAESSGEVAAECLTERECGHLDAACVIGTCANGTCVEAPQTGGQCDDSDNCTIDDACAAGVCVGAAVQCEALDSCHDVGACEPATGLCSNPVRDDSSECDDGLACTDEDRCDGGVCSGSERVCSASDQCHEAGTCNPLTGLCTNPAKDNFTPCDDGDVCTTGEFCSNQRCQAGQPPDDSLGDWVVTIEGDGDAEIHSIVERPEGSVVALGFARGTSVTVRDALGGSSEHALGEYGCALFRLNLTASGTYTGFVVIGGTATCEDGDAISAGLGLVRLADGTFITGGSYFGGPYGLEGVAHELGTSPSGLALEQGMWVGRLGAASTFVWATDMIGAGIQSRTAGYRSLVASPLGTSWLATNAAASGALELVYGADDAEVLLNSETGSATGYLFGLNGSGRRTSTSAIKCTGTCGILPTILTRTADGSLVVGGVAIGGTTIAKAASPGNDITVPTGLTSGFEGWLVGYDATGPRWGRHFYSDFNGVEVGAALGHAAPGGLGTQGLGLFNGQARTRLGSGPSALLASTDATNPPDPTSTNNSYWFGLDATGAVTHAGRLGPMGSVAAVAAADDSGRVILAGRRKAVVPPGTQEVEVIFVTEPGSWDEVVVTPEDMPARLVARLDGASPLSLLLTSNGVLLAANIEAPARVGLTGTRTLHPPTDRNGATIMRINSRHGLECR